MATSVRIDAVPHKIEVMYYHIGNTRYMTFDFKPEPGGEYQCIGNTDNGATLQIKNTKTGEVLIKKEPEGGCWGAWCVN
ncbi:hypothetical protein Lysil_1385 [Lysobacter silvestris]|uniref:Uncharacterized protein n=2 Tax=Solilutibacter silvestris TaxID=1645665 RepID=A0A2K1Q3Y3_9GAMM|nr:hypothetical protein Lysil_1385 [Lysobacter silvestris]